MILLPATLAPGDYSLIVGMYDPADGTRLRVWDAAGNDLGDHVLLTHLAIAAPGE